MVSIDNEVADAARNENDEPRRQQARAADLTPVEDLTPAAAGLGWVASSRGFLGCFLLRRGAAKTECKKIVVKFD